MNRVKGNVAIGGRITKERLATVTHMGVAAANGQSCERPSPNRSDSTWKREPEAKTVAHSTGLHDSSMFGCDGRYTAFTHLENDRTCTDPSGSPFEQSPRKVVQSAPTAVPERNVNSTEYGLESPKKMAA